MVKVRWVGFSYLLPPLVVVVAEGSEEVDMAGFGV